MERIKFSEVHSATRKVKGTNTIWTVHLPLGTGNRDSFNGLNGGRI